MRNRSRNTKIKDKRNRNNQEMKDIKEKERFLQQAKKFGYIINNKKQKIIDEENKKEKELSNGSIDFIETNKEKGNIMDILRSKKHRKRDSSSSSSTTNNHVDSEPKGLVKKKNQKKKLIKKNINANS